MCKWHYCKNQCVHTVKLGLALSTTRSLSLNSQTHSQPQPTITPREVGCFWKFYDSLLLGRGSHDVISDFD